MPEDRKPEILDLDILLPPKRLIRLTERDHPQGLRGLLRRLLRPLGVQVPGRVRVIDLSAIPTGTQLQVEVFLREIERAGRGDDAQTAEDAMLDLLVVVCRHSCPDIDREWLKRNTEPQQVLAMFQFIIKPLVDRAAEIAAQTGKGGGGKN